MQLIMTWRGQVITDVQLPHGGHYSPREWRRTGRHCRIAAHSGSDERTHKLKKKRIETKKEAVLNSGIKLSYDSTYL